MTNDTSRPTPAESLSDLDTPSAKRLEEVSVDELANVVGGNHNGGFDDANSGGPG